MLTITKEHLRITNEDEDRYLTVLILAASEYVQAVTGITIDHDDSDDRTPMPIKAAILLLVGDLYENREAASTQPLHENKAVSRLLAPYRVW